MRPYTLILVGCLLLPGAAWSQAPATVIVPGGSTPDGRLRSGDQVSGRTRWTPQVLATAQPVIPGNTVPGANSVSPMGAALPRDLPNGIRPAAATLPMPPTLGPIAGILRPTVSSRATSRGDEARSAALLVERIVPETAPNGRPLSYEIVIRNTGAVPVHGIRVEEALPVGARPLSGDPKPEVRGQSLLWDLGLLAPGAETRLKVQVEASAGVYVSSATVSAASTHTMRTQVEAAALTTGVGSTGGQVLEPTGGLPPIPPSTPNATPLPPIPPGIGSTANTASASAPASGTWALAIPPPPSVRVGETVALRVDLMNQGTTPARKLLVRVKLPPGLKHAAGDAVEAEVQGPGPGETTPLPLPLLATKAGRHSVEAMIIGEGSGEIRAQSFVEITEALPSAAPPPAAPTSPPPLAVANPVVPKGPETADSRRPGGPQPEAPKRREAFASGEAPSLVPSLVVDVVCLDDPVEIGGTTTYEIRVNNPGTVPAQAIQVSLSLPEGLTLITAEGPVNRQANGGQIAFEALSQLDPRGRAVYRVRARGAKPGDWRLRVFVKASHMARPEFKEVSTRVYNDRDLPKGTMR